MNEKTFDVIVVGGGPAGLSAALILGRMRREVLLLDTAAPANAVSNAMHGFLGQDGVPPAAVRQLAGDQLQPYRSIERRTTAAVAGRRVAEGFEITLEHGGTVAGRRVLLAHGMRYGLPDLKGASELWGRSIFHCPYCHGWEVRDQTLAVHAGGPKAVHQALLLHSLSDEVVFLAVGGELAGEDRARLQGAGVEIVEDPVERLVEAEGGLRVEFTTGRDSLPRQALFIQPDLSLASDLGPALGAALTPVGSIETNTSGETTVPGLYAAGDAGAEVQSVAVATGGGARAAYAINSELALEEAR